MNHNKSKTSEAIIKIETPLETRVILYEYLLTTRPKDLTRAATARRVEAARDAALHHGELWRDCYEKWANNSLWDDPLLFISTPSDDRRRAVKYFWEWMVALTVHDLPERSERVTWETLAYLCGSRYDITINDDDAQTLWAEFAPILKRERNAFSRERKAHRQDCNRRGIDPEDISSGEYLTEPFDARAAIADFLDEKFGEPCGFDRDDNFSPSAYVRKFGKTFNFENLNDLKKDQSKKIANE